MIEDSASFQFREILFASWIAGLRVLRLSAGFKKENSPKNQVPLCYHVTDSGKRIPFLWFDMSFRPLLALFPGRAPFSVQLPLPCILLLRPAIPFVPTYNRAFHPRVISPRQPPSMVFEVYVLARTKFKIPKTQSRDTSPADRSLCSQVTIGCGLMARDTLALCRILCTTFSMVS